MKIRVSLALVSALLLSACGLNSVPTAEENAKARWADVQATYQRRADLIPNLVATAKGAAASEGKILSDVVEARAKATSVQVGAGDLTDPAKVAQYQAAQQQLSGSLSRLLVTVEKYPELKSQANFATLMQQLEGTENRITIAIRDYNGAVQGYNTTIRTFPDSIGATIFYAPSRWCRSRRRRARTSRRRSISETAADRAGGAEARMNMRNWRHWLAALLLVLLGTGVVAAQNFPKLSGRVVDAANLLSPEQEAQLTQLSTEIEQASSRQLVVATVPDLQDHPIEDYGYRLGRAWKIGQQGASNGIILLVAPKERKVRIEVGYGLEPIMTDALAGTIIRDTILPRFRDGDMAGGIMAGSQEIAAQMKLPLEAAEARAKQKIDAAAKSGGRKKKDGVGPLVGIFWAIVFFAIVVPMILGGRRGRRYRGGGSGIMPIILWSALDAATRSRGGGGWGGGGGGGGSGWGGGGGFSGGGGSFGGGGASGGW